jgi:hypothetical protein
MVELDTDVIRRLSNTLLRQLALVLGGTPSYFDDERVELYAELYQE